MTMVRLFLSGKDGGALSSPRRLRGEDADRQMRGSANVA